MEPSKEGKGRLIRRRKRITTPGKKVPHGQSGDPEQPAEKSPVCQPVRGREHTRRSDVDRGIPARRRLVHELSRASLLRILGHRERRWLQRAPVSEQEKEEAGIKPGAKERK